MYRKLFALFVAIALFLCLSCSTYANTENEFPFIDQNVVLETPEAFQSFYDSSDICNIQYNYAMSMDENDSGLAQCTITMIIETNNGCYEASAQGTVTEYVDSKGISIWHGPLHGTIEINNNKYTNVTLGFTKLDNGQNIHASVSMFDTNISSQPVFFSFGDIEIMDAFVEMFASARSSSDDNAQIIPIDEAISPCAVIPTPGDLDGGFPDLGENGEWDFLVFDVDYYGGVGIDYYALQSRAYFSSGTDRVMITAMSFCDNIAENHENFINTWAEVKSIDVELEVLSQDTEEFVYIAAVQKNDFDHSNKSKPGQLIAPLFEDVLSLMGVPTSTLSAILSQQTGTVDYDHYGNTAYCSIEVPSLSEFSFDDEPGLPFVFVLENSDDENYVGGSRLCCTTTVDYLIWGHSMITCHDTFTYLTCNTEINFEVTI